MDTGAVANATGSAVRDVMALLVAVAGLAMCLVLLFQAIRAVMDSGGYCAEGGPHAIETHCPEGATPALLLGILRQPAAAVPDARSPGETAQLREIASLMGAEVAESTSSGRSAVGAGVGTGDPLARRRHGSPA